MTEMPQTREIPAVFASGRVDAVDPKEHRIRISHGPIEALSWPSMTMEFPVREGVDLSRIKVGQELRFALIQGKAGEYAIQQVFSDAGKFGAQAGVQTRESETAAETSEQEQRFTGRAIVKSVDPADHQLTLEHDPIVALKWPAMTMKFDVLGSVDLSQLSAGQDVHFSLLKRADGSFVVEQVHVTGTEPEGGGGIEGQSDD